MKPIANLCSFGARDAGALLANAFYLENVPYTWRRGIRESLS